ncbi:MAG: response regulator [Deltaproteobacteria bacterium]|nr:response regulator [Deltaproteobacteria bacterium]
MKILVVDDKEDARYLLTALLAGHGHTVAEAANGQEALAQLRADAFDLVVSDILMPVMDGFKLCREVRKDDRLKSILFIFYTATYIQETDAAFARQIGADDFVLKPAEPEALLARIQAVVDKVNARDWAPHAPELIDEADVLRLYSERLVAKLEKRTLDLDRELGERQRAEAVARRQAERLAMLRSIDSAILAAQSPSQIAEAVLDVLTSLVRPARGSVVRFDDAMKAGTILAVRDETASGLSVGTLAPVAHFGDLERLTQGEPHRVNNLPARLQRTSTEEHLLRAGILSYVTIPLRAADRLVGSLNLGFTTPDGPTEECAQIAEEVGNQLAIALRQAGLREEIEASCRRLSLALSQTVQALAAAAEVRDPYTAGHQKRVTELAVAIAEKLGLPSERIDGLQVAGLMHDIGKLAIPSELLSKPSKLTGTERALIQEHPKVAHEILQGIEFPWPVASIVFQHHERLDGSGYPLGLRGDDILLESRILAVADVVEAMASHRPYRPALGVEAALEEIRAGRGQRYDAQAVDACIAVLESGSVSF